MKRVMTAAAVLFLTGCGPMTPTIDGNAISIVVSQVQAFSVKLCSFLPTDQSIVDIIKATQGGETAYAIASAICQRVTASPTIGALGANTAPCPVVAGVCVEGEFVDPKEYEKMKEDPIPNAKEGELGIGAPPPTPAPTAPPPGGP